MQNREGLNERFLKYIRDNHFAMVKGLPGIGKSTFAYMNGLRIFSNCCMINCETDYDFVLKIKNTYNIDKNFLYQLIAEKTGLKNASASNADFEKILIIFDNIDSCAEIADFIFEILFEYKAYAVFTYSAETASVKKVIEEMELTLSTTADKKNVHEPKSYDFIFLLNPFSYEDYIYYYTDDNFLIPTMLSNVSAGRSIYGFVFENAFNAFDEYLYWGGMPGCHKEYVQSNFDFEIILSMQSNMHYYYYSITKLFERGGLNDKQRNKCIDVLRAVIKQMLLADEYHKFNICAIREGASFSTYSDAIEFLVENNILICAKRFEAKREDAAYYFYDCGLLYCLLRHFAGKFKMKNTENKIKELCIRNFIIQEAKYLKYDIYYWKSRYSAVIDMIVKKDDKILAFKIKDGDDLRSKSLEIFKKNICENAELYLVSRSNLLKKSNYYNIPYFAISSILQ